MNRRDFLIGGAAGTVAVAAPAIAKAETVVLKVQAAWGGGIFLENAKAMLTASTPWPAAP